MARPKMIKTGIGLIAISIIASVAPTVIGMLSAFNEVASDGSVDAEKLADDIGSAMLWTATLMPVMFIGLCLLITGLIIAPKQTLRGEPGAISRRQLP